MSSGENIFDAAVAGPRAARLQRQRQEDQLGAIRRESEERLAAARVAATGRRDAMAAYRDLTDTDATVRGVLLEEYFDEKSARTAIDFLGFMATLGNVGSNELTTLIPSGSQVAPWSGRGYPIPYAQPLQYLCTDQRIRADYVNGVVLRGWMHSTPGVSLDSRPRPYKTEQENAHWLHHKVTSGWDLMTAHDNSPPPDKVEDLPAHGKIVRHYAYRSAAEIMVAFAVTADEMRDETPLFSDVLPDLSAPVLERTQGIGHLDDQYHPNYGAAVTSYLHEG